MLYMVGVILQRDKMPSASAIQDWFDRHNYPLTIDEFDILESKFIVSGSAIGQRCYTDFHHTPAREGTGLFDLVYSNYFEQGDSVYSAVATASLTQRAFVFLVISAIVELSGGLLIEKDDPDPSETKRFIEYSLDFLVRARLLLLMLYRQGQSKHLHLDTEAVSLMEGETVSDRKAAVSSLSCDKYISARAEKVPVHKRMAYRLTNSGLELARSMYLFDISERSQQHRHLIVAKES